MLDTLLILPNARLIGLWLQLFVTGAYLVYLPQCVTILRTKMREMGQGCSIWLPVVCAFMFVITFLVLALEMILAYHAFAVSGPNALANPNVVYNDVGSIVSVVRNACTVVLAIVSDLIIVYRTYLVWTDNTFVILVPAGLLLANVALGIWSLWSLAQTHVGSDVILAAVTVHVRYFFIVTFCLNMLCAVLICWKIWSVLSQIPSHIPCAGRPTSRVFELIIETAAIYCAHLFILIVSDILGSNLFFIFLGALPPVTALAFTALIVHAQRPRRDHYPPTVHIASDVEIAWENRPS